jgi:predicted Zn-dependent peptidase
MAAEFKHVQLDNGLTIVAEVSPTAHTSAVGFFVKTGCRDESLDVMGVSHFLEHMMFKGTARRSAADVNREFDELGANYNASTSQEVTNYWAHVLPEMLPRAIDLLSDILRPSLRGDDFDVEKKVILEEISMYADKPFWTVYEQAMEDFFGKHPLGFRILGTNDSITALKRDQMMAYFEQRYSPENITVSLAGKLDFDRCVEQIASVCGKWARHHAQRSYGGMSTHAGDRTLAKSDANMHYALTITPGPSAQDEERYAAAVLSTILGDSDGSRLYWSLIDPGIAEDAELSHQPFDRFGMFMGFVSCDPANADKVEAILQQTINTAAENITDGEIQRAVSKIAMDMTLNNERPAGRMMALGGQWLYLNRYIPMSEELARVQRVNADEIRAMVKKFPFQPRTIVRLKPG